MFRECVRVSLGTEFAQKLSRPLDVGKHERDGAGRKLAHFFWASCNAGNDVL